jgi:hypothetical protein
VGREHLGGVVPGRHRLGDQLGLEPAPLDEPERGRNRRSGVDARGHERDPPRVQLELVTETVAAWDDAAEVLATHQAKTVIVRDDA